VVVYAKRIKLVEMVEKLVAMEEMKNLKKY
jgi:hypothetical protein